MAAPIGEDMRGLFKAMLRDWSGELRCKTRSQAVCATAMQRFD